ncbi:MAG: LysE family translocator [Phenylobacterium sp.]|uniref:LysE family translocator n=1 Tax=Phenylobacterium sp. TaxID=1871053 RepID=UPI001B772DB8|nr:LysE family translocator [Phenylobacterium sp.]MBP7651391.1 LysE family translocator [Phenylobacterium sp.]MBP7815814.1 LysE family translocator [Phenylobacterium sp.]MBP9230133.1 LysE family translocator [Phenylobacterium sp.]MBP9754672.1 LysE family translocator [Phenylobacterium sp.]
MTVVQALIAFTVAAGLLTLTPGLDTALILRTAAVEGPKRAVLAMVGILAGCFVWGGLAAFGLGAVLQASAEAFHLLKWAGAAYLVWLGIGLILRPRASFEVNDTPAMPGSDVAWMRRGFLSNVLNPKMGVFYVSFLPQFLPAGVPAAPFMLLLTTIHVLLGVVWLGLLIAATQPIAKILKRAVVVRWLDRATGGVFVAFGLGLAFDRR